MTYYLVTEKKDDVAITHCFESPHEAIDWMETGFIASLDDSANAGTVFSIEEKP